MPESPAPLSAAAKRNALCDAISRGGYVSLATRRAVIDMASENAALTAEVEALRTERAVGREIRGDGPCQDCGADNIVWFAPNVVWNHVMAPDGEIHHGDPGGIVCVTCFVKRAHSKGLRPTGWQVSPEWPWALARETNEA